MWHPPIKLGSKVVNNNTRSQRLYSKYIIRKKNNLRKIFIKKRKNILINSYEYSELIANKLIRIIQSNNKLKMKKDSYWNKYYKKIELFNIKPSSFSKFCYNKFIKATKKKIF